MNDQQRFEFKFLITARQRDEAIHHFNGALRPDTNGGSGCYPIVSLYYDTPDRRCYWEAWRGMPSRRKLRVRVYGTTDGGIPPTAFVEVKGIGSVPFRVARWLAKSGLSPRSFSKYCTAWRLGGES